ncbi:MAG: hypothetical protein KJ587_06385 [Alphaproteobacteria bacterium]|nr:hypothetical protein [Alphaproteobacteria bacterium]
MILRRLTKHVKDQNWFAVSLDFIFVLGGICMGLQFQGRNAAREHLVEAVRVRLFSA